MPLMVAAQVLGHSDTRMVEKHYGHLAQSYVREAVRATALHLGPVEGNVAASAAGGGVMNKIRERARLLQAFKETGDEDYRRAAECLRLTLLDQLKFLSAKAKKGRGLGAAGKTARPRLFRMLGLSCLARPDLGCGTARSC